MVEYPPIFIRKIVRLRFHHLTSIYYNIITLFKTFQASLIAKRRTVPTYALEISPFLEFVPIRAYLRTEYQGFSYFRAYSCLTRA